MSVEPTRVRGLIANEGVAMAISGHRTRAIFDRYNITSDDDLREAVSKRPSSAREPAQNQHRSSYRAAPCFTTD